MDIKAVILAGRRDFGRCRLATQLPMMLWPIAGRAVIERLLDNLFEQGIHRATICFSDNDDEALIARSINCPENMEVTFLDEPLPLGTAGCVRDSIRNKSLSQILVLHANMASPPAIKELLEEHRNTEAELTVLLNPISDNGSVKYDQTAGIYICNSTILEHIPKMGYYDIKESLIPALLKAGKTIRSARLPHRTGNFNDWTGYLNATREYLKNSIGQKTNGENICIEPGANVHPTAKIYGPVIVQKNASIAENVVIFGPTIIGQAVTVGHDSLITDSVIWDDTHLARQCEVQNCLLAYDTNLPGNTTIQGRLIVESAPEQSYLDKGQALIRQTPKTKKLKSFLQPSIDEYSRQLPTWARFDSDKHGTLVWLFISAVIVSLIWSYWATIAELANIWRKSDEYSAGLLVPFLACYIIWSRRHQLAKYDIRPSWAGAWAFVAVQVFRYFGLYYMYSSAERLSLVLSVAALVLLLLGWRLFWKLTPVVLFLFLMLPLPRTVESRLTLPLQSWATTSAVFALETVGYSVTREGNVIHLGQTTVAVAEACNGLRMVTAFFVISGLVALLIDRKPWEKFILLLSTLPIAMACNTIRLALTTVAFTMLNSEQWEAVFHDFGGYAMMPIALAMVVFEIWLLHKAFIVEPEDHTGNILINRPGR